MRYKLDSLLKINKHLGIALVELQNHPYLGSMEESRKLIRIKIKLENIIEKTIKNERFAKREFFDNIKQ